MAGSIIKTRLNRSVFRFGWMLLTGLCWFVNVGAQDGLHRYVNPMIGTGGHGHTFPGATLPFGMVQLSPDTRVDGSWDGCSGYHYSDTFIYGFTHTHLSGTGVSDYGDILLMPYCGNLSFESQVYGSAFSHPNEKAIAGKYSVLLQDENIQADLTATQRCGYHQYIYPRGKESRMVIDLRHRDELLDAQINIVNSTTIEGYRISRAWAKEQHVYFVMEFSRPFKKPELLTIALNHEKIPTHKVAAVLTYDTRKQQELKVKVGISFTSIEGARKNLKAEISGWPTVEEVSDKAAAAWNKELSLIQVEGGTEDEKVIFYTAMYHTMIHPNIACDVDGNYRGHDMKIRKAEGYNHYTVFSLWDTFRAAHPLYNLIMPQRSLDFIKSILEIGKIEGRLPVWELASCETDCMIGYHGTSVIADALAKGITGFNQEEAFELMLKSAGYSKFGIDAYGRNGYLDVETEPESVSKTLEYAYDDWCIARVAEITGNKNEWYDFILRSQSWKNIFNPATGFMQPRKNGSWLVPFHPADVNNHFTEANSWQYSFFVPHDIYGLVDAFRGRNEFENKLDELFSAPQQTLGRSQADITGLIGQYAHGNEPSHHMAFLYNYIRKPSKTQYYVNKIRSEFYLNTPDGLIGNEDCGQMSAWYVFAASGLYPVCPGTDVYALCAPVFSKISVKNDKGNTLFTVLADGASKALPYAADPAFGKRTAGFFVKHKDLQSNAVLSYNMTADSTNVLPALSHYFDPSERLPKSLEITPIPVFKSGLMSFKDSVLIEIEHPDYFSFRLSKLYYIINEGEWTRYEKPFYVKNESLIQAKAIQYGRESATITRVVKPRQNQYKTTLYSTPNPQYFAGGTDGLTDGLRGDTHWKKGLWHGYQGQDFVAVIDMTESKNIQQINAGFLEDTRSWIFFPTEISIETSEDGENYTYLGKSENGFKYKTLESGNDNISLQNFSVTANAKARYIKITAKNYGKLPEWHPGRGGDAFIFIDEIEIE